MNSRQLRIIKDRAFLFKFTESEEDLAIMAEVDQAIKDDIEDYYAQIAMEKLGGPKAKKPIWLETLRGIA